MKLPHYQNYRAQDTERCEQALLTVWAKLRRLADEMVLIGGLVPRYLCVTRQHEFPPQTLDVDVGIALGASSGIYDPISVCLSSDGFSLLPGTARFEKKFDTVTLHVDFLTEKEHEDDPDARMVDDVPAQAILGLSRAISLARKVQITGRDLHGADVTEDVRVCEVGPFLALKLVAYSNRAEGKDVFDVVRSGLNYRDGYEKAISLFRAEAGVNGAYPKAAQILVERFGSPASKGPVDYAEFCLAARRGQMNNDDFGRLYQERTNEAFLLAERLLNG